MKKLIARYCGRIASAWRFVSPLLQSRYAAFLCDCLSLVGIVTTLGLGMALAGLLVVLSAYLFASSTAALVVSVVFALGVVFLFAAGFLVVLFFMMTRLCEKAGPYSPAPIDPQRLMEDLLRPPHQRTYADEHAEASENAEPLNENIVFSKGL